MSVRAGSPRWVMSFADLCVLLLGFFVLLHAQAGNPERMAAGVRQAFGAPAAAGPVRTDYAATRVFERGEAVLKPVWRDTIAQLGAGAARSKARVRIASEGADPGTQRLDGWELAAARAAAIARVLRAAGVPESKLEIAMPPMTGGQAGGQRIGIIVE